MPTYAFRCPKGHEFDRFYRTISGAAAELPCPECGAVAQRLISGGAGLAFKGSGFYLTDYGKNAHRKAEPAKAEGSKSEASKTEAPKADAAKPKAESPKPQAASPKPKSE